MVYDYKSSAYASLWTAHNWFSAPVDQAQRTRMAVRPDQKNSVVYGHVFCWWNDAHVKISMGLVLISFWEI